MLFLMTYLHSSCSVQGVLADSTSSFLRYTHRPLTLMIGAFNDVSFINSDSVMVTSSPTANLQLKSRREFRPKRFIPVTEVDFLDFDFRVTLTTRLLSLAFHQEGKSTP